jgi:hypothetical protein
MYPWDTVSSRSLRLSQLTGPRTSARARVGRLDERTENEWGGKQTERELIARLHQTKEDIPKNGILIDATAPIAHVVDEIVRKAKQINSHNAGAW